MTRFEAPALKVSQKFWIVPPRAEESLDDLLGGQLKGHF
jgi:hypothetical protein